MKVEGYLFALLAAFLLPVTVVYWWYSKDTTGTTALVFSIFMAFIIAYYLLFTARRMQARPEDLPDAEIADGAGEVGFFAPHSWWPMALAASFTVTILGLAFGPFLIMVGGVFLLVSVSGFLFEYYVGINRTQSQTLGALQALGEQPTSNRKFLGE